MTCLIIGIIALNGYYLHKNYTAQKDNWRSTAEYLKVNAISEDTILITSNIERCLTYYGIDPERIIELTKENDLLIKTKEIRARYNSTWILYSNHTKVRDPQQEMKEWLNQTCNKERELEEVSIYLCKSDSFNSSLGRTNVESV